MKKILFISLLSLAAIFTSCKKDNNNADSEKTTSSEQYLKAKIDGEMTDFSDRMSVPKYQEDFSPAGFSKKHMEYPQEMLQFTFEVVGTGIVELKHGHYDTFQSASDFAIFFQDDDSKAEVNILENNNKYVKGSFEFTVIRKGKSIKITEGEFLILK